MSSVRGIGCDIAGVERFRKWVSSPAMIARFFNSKEILSDTSASEQRLCEHYAVRFAAKEAFSKALGTGLSGFDLRDVYIVKDKNSRPFVAVQGRAREVLEKICGKNCSVHVSLSHEKEYAMAFVAIEG